MEKKYNILVVDDNVGTIDIISMILHNEGYDVTADPTAELAFLSTGKNPDLILLDNQVGEKSGTVICQELKQQENTRKIPVILFSGMDNIKELANEACADDHLAKPFCVKELFEKIQALLSKKLTTA